MIPPSKSRIGVAPQDCGDPEVTWLTARAVALLVICRQGACTIGMISRAIGEPKEAVRQLAIDLSGMGMASITPSQTAVQLTDEGRDWLVRSRSML